MKTKYIFLKKKKKAISQPWKQPTWVWIFGKSLNSFAPLFSHFWDGGDNRTHTLGLMRSDVENGERCLTHIEVIYMLTILTEDLTFSTDSIIWSFVESNYGLGQWFHVRVTQLNVSQWAVLSLYSTLSHDLDCLMIPALLPFLRFSLGSSALHQPPTLPLCNLWQNLTDSTSLKRTVSAWSPMSTLVLN